MVGAALPDMQKEIYEHSLSKDNPYALQVKSGSRGNAMQLRQLVMGDGLVMDHRDNIIGVPILHGYAHGLDPAEYFAASYGTRKGAVSTKFATQDAGFAGKQMSYANHRLVITSHDCGANTGIPVVASDPDNVGTVLAMDSGKYKAGTIMTPEMLKSIGDKEIVVRSPATCQAKDGLCSKCVGVREKGRLPDVGDNVGVPAAQAISEKLSQGMLSAKHTGGAVGAGGGGGGFSDINDHLQVPESFGNAATVAQVDGRVDKIEDAPQGGQFVLVNGTKHYVKPEHKTTVKAGQVIEAGDALSTGVPNPAELVQHKGIGEGRRLFINSFKNALESNGVKTNRRQVEMLSRGLINHVRITDPDGYEGFLPDDIVNFDEFKSRYQPREGTITGDPAKLVGHYLEKPVVNYMVGTRVTPSVAKGLTSRGVNEISAHPSPPPFEPVMIRAMETAMRDPDPISRLGGSYGSKGMMESVHRARSSKDHSTSFIPSLISGTEFGKDLNTTGKY
jgi:DNA-directed RNA polymerase subunit beta'